MADNETTIAAASDNKLTKKGEKQTEAQLIDFLISCIRHSNGGKIDFGNVAEECGIVSKGAAAKRWARLMKARGLPPSASLMDPAGSKGTAANSDSQLLSSSPAPKAKPPVAKKTAAPKKRKASESDAEDHGSHDEPKAAPKKRARKQPAKKSAKKATVETEDEGEGSLDGYDGSFDATDPLSKTKV